MELNKYIKELLLVKDNVIIQDFGAFEKVTVSASIDEKSGEMTPPHTNVIFRPELKIDNGVLVKYIAEKEDVDEAKATEEIKKQASLWQSNIDNKKNVIIPGIGIIHKNDAGEIVFQSNMKPSDFPESYGLSTLKVQEKSSVVKEELSKNKNKKNQKKPIKKTQKQKTPVKKTAKQKQVKKTSETGGSKLSTKQVVGIVVGVILIGLVVFGAIYFDSVKSAFNSTTEWVGELFSGEENEADTAKDDNITELDSLPDVNEDTNNLETEAILKDYTLINEATNTKIEPKMEELSSVKKVHIIAGSFKDKAHAKRHRNKLSRKGFASASVLSPKNGLYRVSVGSYDKIEQAVAEFERIKTIDGNLSVWILVNK